MVHLTLKARGALRAQESHNDAATGPPQRKPAYIRVHGRIYTLTPKALANYFREYGLDRGVPHGLDECVEHIAGEMEIALSRERKAVGIRGRLSQYESPGLIFKLVGSKVVNIRISLRTGPFTDGETTDRSMRSNP